MFLTLQRADDGNGGFISARDESNNVVLSKNVDEEEFLRSLNWFIANDEYYVGEGSQSDHYVVREKKYLEEHSVIAEPA